MWTVRLLTGRPVMCSGSPSPAHSTAGLDRLLGFVGPGEIESKVLLNVIRVRPVDADLGHLKRLEGRFDVERRPMRLDEPGEAAYAGFPVEDAEDDRVLAVPAGGSHISSDDL